MRMTLILFMLMTTAVSTATAKRPAGDPRLSSLGAFVDGDSEAATAVRRDLVQRQNKYEDHACFQISENEERAHGILTIRQNETTKSSFGVGTGSLVTVVTGTLKDSNGNLLWSDSKQGTPGLIHTGAGDAAIKVLRALWGAAGCNSSISNGQNGKR